MSKNVKRLHVRCAFEDEHDSYVFQLETEHGLERVWPPGYEGQGESATTPSKLLKAWLVDLQVTHVISKFGERETTPECIADGTYTVQEYVRWWKLAEQA